MKPVQVFLSAGLVIDGSECVQQGFCHGVSLRLLAEVRQFPQPAFVFSGISSLGGTDSTYNRISLFYELIAFFREQ